MSWTIRTTCPGREPSRRPRSLALVAVLCAGCFIDTSRPVDARARCVGGDCDCVEGFGNCDGNLGNGCETDLATDPRHCGACGHACLNASCVTGVCWCNGGYKDCDGLTETVCETDLARDAQNCGDCGRDCRGGQCVGEVCQPLALVDELAYPSALIIGAGQAFFDHGSGSIMAVSLVEPFLRNVLVVEDDGVLDLAFDGTRLFWLSNSALRSLDPSTPGSETTLATGADPRALALSPSHVYVTRWNDQLLRVDKAGGQPPDVLADNAASAPSVAGQHVYWSESGGPIWRQPLSGGSAESFDTSEFHWHVASHAGYLYWATWESYLPTLYRRLLSDGERELLAVLPRETNSLVVVDGGIYLTDQGSGTVQQLPVDGGEATILARGQVYVRDVAVDDEFVYWLTRDNLMRLVRHPGE